MANKAVLLLEQIGTTVIRNADPFILGLVPSSPDESVLNFVTSMIVLASSANQILLYHSDLVVSFFSSHSELASTTIRLSLINLDLIPQLLSAINTQSLSLEEAPNIVLSLIDVITHSLSLTSPQHRARIEIEHLWGTQAIYDTVLAHILVPSGEFIRHLCLNHHMFHNDSISVKFVPLLMTILQICHYHQPSIDFIQTLPLFITILNYITFCSSDLPISYCLYDLLDELQEWSQPDDNIHQSGTTGTRLLMMEGFSDVLEEMIVIDKEGENGGYVMEYSISLSNLFGGNCADLE
ncbi:hypothetical protein BLNAU_24507 [Blattamonas nauphoetae]|uniref:Uncharacterized protein n=1 Tax=Blattamonas nauphoetae TaxID=2049346 RepID=A0ABQ9WMN6_9EUKA|nr:hypothetical protein BLNAU_24507 [Blattamonas nauphoetae]